MNDSEISRFPIPNLEDLPEDVRERILSVQEKAGFVPNVFITLAHRPAEFRAFFDYHDAVMMREGGQLTKAEKEMIIVATSAANGCQYCVVAHGALLRVYAKAPLLADQIATNYLHAPITDRQRAMIDFAITLTKAPETVAEDDFEILYQYDFDDEDIWDIAGITAFFGLSNRMAILTRMQPNSEFYMMGREPRT